MAPLICHRLGFLNEKKKVFLAASISKRCKIQSNTQSVVGVSGHLLLSLGHDPPKMTELRHRGGKDTDPTVQEQPSEDKVMLAGPGLGSGIYGRC